MRVYRLSKAAFKADLNGKGAELAGGRWNSKGSAMVYTSESRSLCTAEVAVHTPLGIVPSEYYLVTVEIPDDLKIYELTLSKLPSDWKTLPHPNSTQIIGDNFLKEKKFAVMKVPSAVVTGDFNYLVNPNHPDARKIKIVKSELFEFDKRLFKG